MEVPGKLLVFNCCKTHGQKLYESRKFESPFKCCRSRGSWFSKQVLTHFIHQIPGSITSIWPTMKGYTHFSGYLLQMTAPYKSSHACSIPSITSDSQKKHPSFYSYFPTCNMVHSISSHTCVASETSHTGTKWQLRDRTHLSIPWLVTEIHSFAKTARGKLISFQFCTRLFSYSPRCNYLMNFP